MQTEKELIYFLHIPKTAGVTVGTYLSNQFNDAEIFNDYHGWNNLSASLRTNPNAYKLIIGHFTRSPLQFSNYTIISFFRNPQQRIISEFKYRQKIPDTHDPINRLAKDKNIEEFFLSRDYKRNIDHDLGNLQARYIGQDFFDPYARVQSNASVLEHASIALKTMTIGLTEHMAMSLDFIAYRFGFFPLLKIPTQNSSNHSSLVDLSDPLLDRISSLTEMDTAIYAQAKEIFRSNMVRFLFDLFPEFTYSDCCEAITSPERYESLRPTILLKLIERCKATASINLDITNTYNFRTPLWGWGWYNREYSDDGQSCWRWNGLHDSSTIYLRSNIEGGYKIAFRIRNQATPIDCADIEIRVNDSRFPIKEQVQNYYNDRRFLYFVSVESLSIVRLELIKIEFLNCDRFRTTNNESKDDRHLGYCLDWLKLVESDCSIYTK